MEALVRDSWFCAVSPDPHSQGGSGNHLDPPQPSSLNCSTVPLKAEDAVELESMISFQGIKEFIE